MSQTITAEYAPPLPYIATINNVQEVLLVGSAAGAFWQEKLAAVGLRPILHDGQAEVSISSIFGRFKGWPFRELVIAVTVEPEPFDAAQTGMYLVHAFNSSRVLGWCERTMFHTPYYFAHIENSATPPARMVVRSGPDVPLDIVMAGVARSPATIQHEAWAGPLFLPPRAKSAHERNVFFADLRGETTTYPFLPDIDQLTLRPTSTAPAIGWLRDSGFVGRSWKLRPTAVHARTKTMARAERASR